MTEEKKFYTLTEVADILGVVRLTLYNEIKRGNIVAMKVGKNYRISFQELQNYIHKNETVTNRNTSGDSK